MGFVSELGRWLDNRFPEKINAEEVYRSLSAYENLGVRMVSLEFAIKRIDEKLTAFSTGAQSFDKEQREFKDEINKIKAVLMVQKAQTVRPVLNGAEPWKR